MLDPVFIEAVCHKPGGHTILGRALHPLCAHDLLCLEAIKSPFLTDGATVTMEDLVLAVWLLSHEAPADLTVSHLELDATGRHWLKKLMAAGVDLQAETDRLLSYLKDYYSPPEMMRDQLQNSQPLGSPWMLTLVVVVCGKLGISLREAWTMGIGQLIWYRSSIEEQETESRIVGPELREQMDRAREGPAVLKLEPGESIEDFAARGGLSVGDAAMLLHQQSHK